MEINYIVETIRRGEIDKAYKKIQLLINRISVLLEDERSKCNQDDLLLQKLEELIGEINSAMVNYDVIYLIDLLKYELVEYITME